MFFDFSQSVVTGVGAGIVIALVAAYVIKVFYLPKISPLFLISFAFATYTLAENLGGSGILAVTSFALVFGNIGIHNREKLEGFTSIFTNFLQVIVFILLGIIIRVPLNLSFFLKSLLLFGVYVLIRYFSVVVAFRDVDMTPKERWFMALTGAKGMDTGVMVLVMGSILLVGMEGSGSGLVISESLRPALSTIFELSFIFIVYSIVVSSFVARFSHKFLRSEDEMRKKELMTKADLPDFGYYSA